MSTPPRGRRHRTRFWFAFYTLVLLGVVVVCALTGQWSVAATALAITVVFAWYTRRLWRRR